MKLKKLSEDHYIVVDDSEIKEGDYCTTHLNIIDVGKIHNSYTIFNPQNKEHLDLLKSCKKITHSTQPLGFLNEVGLTTANLKPDWTNVEYLPLSEVKELLCVVDAKKKYTEEDMVEAYKMGLMTLSDQRLKDYMQEKTEWEVEFIDGKLQLVKE